jgi:hypothetical protein
MARQLLKVSVAAVGALAGLHLVQAQGRIVTRVVDNLAQRLFDRTT